MKRHQIAYLIVLALLVLAPVQAEATSHTLALLCTKINCSPVLDTILPKIDQVLQAEITPGGVVVIKGSRFGDEGEQLHLTGLKNYLGTSVPIKLTIPASGGYWDFWTPTQVVGFVPDPLTHVTDQPVKLRIKTKNNMWSNEFPVNFKATRDIKVLTESDVHSVSCSTESDYDSCTGVSLDWNVIPFCNAPLVSHGGGTFRGYHWTCVGDSDGDDSFRFSLREKYGWSLYGGADLYYSTGGVDPPVIESGPQDWGVTYTKVSLHWNNATVSYVLYNVNVSIIGPKGVPHY